MPLFLVNIAFLFGIIALQSWVVLPELFYLNLILILVLLPWHYSNLIYKFLVLTYTGFCWAALQAHFIAAGIPEHGWPQEVITIRGYLASIPQQGSYGSVNFLFKMQHPLASMVHLTWYHPPMQLQAGDTWQLPVKLGAIHTNLNPGGFDYEKLAFTQGILGQGRVIADGRVKHLTVNYWGVMRLKLRSVIKDYIEVHVDNKLSRAYLLALLLGDRSLISSEIWAVLQNTGTNHLIAIAGLHLGFVAHFAHVFAQIVRLLSPYCANLMPAQVLGAWFALLAATIYAGMADFALPTQRALIMLEVSLFGVIMRRAVQPWHSINLALCIILVYDPLSVNVVSFWLSFVTVSVLVFSFSASINNMTPAKLQRWYRPQLVIALALLPMSIYLFGQYSLLGFIANSIAIPWVGLVILPLALLGLLCCWIPYGGVILLHFAGINVSCLHEVLARLAQYENMIWYQALPQGWTGIIYCVGGLCAVVVILLPSGVPGKWFAPFLLLPLLTGDQHSIPYGSLEFTLLDVGQGLSAVIHTQHHVLVFDTGPKIGATDQGERTVVPFLRDNNWRAVDLLIVSHGDNDHAGGAKAIIQALPVRHIMTSVPELFPGSNVDYCVANTSWSWDGVKFKFIFPPPQYLHHGNNSSCVLHITTNAGQGVLLTGDIERPAEEWLVKNMRQELASDILIAPHHGSKTSGLPSFLAAVYPRYVLYSTGYHNRYHFPHPSIVKLYQQLGVAQFNTANDGAIYFYLAANQVLVPSLYRQSVKSYWHTI